MRTFIAIVSVVGLLAASCSSSSSGAGTSGDGGAGSVVTVTNFKFTPAEITIKPGDSVVWDFREGNHNVVSGANCVPDNAFTSGPVKPAPNQFTRKFDTAGTFNYHCEPHCPMGMVGKVIVAP